mmetsp:Transcript_33820/g.56534  ORF Transcript_33820/g.56534 Transcript_33820/m.56534 type:complete len:88 (+) Transcript_33820:86-349(+)
MKNSRQHNSLFPTMELPNLSVLNSFHACYAYHPEPGDCLHNTMHINNCGTRDGAKMQLITHKYVVTQHQLHKQQRLDVPVQDATKNS